MTGEVTVHNRKNRSCPIDAVDIGRPTPLGNPYTHLPHLTNLILVASREEAVAQFRPWLWRQMQWDSPQRREMQRLVTMFRLAGSLRLVCHCAPLACHGDVVARAVIYYARVWP